MRHRFPFFALILFLCGCVTGPSSVPKAGPVNTAVLPTNKNNKPGPKIQTPSKRTNSGNPIEYPEVFETAELLPLPKNINENDLYKAFVISENSWYIWKNEWIKPEEEDLSIYTSQGQFSLKNQLPELPKTGYKYKVLADEGKTKYWIWKFSEWIDSEILPQSLESKSISLNNRDLIYIPRPEFQGPEYCYPEYSYVDNCLGLYSRTDYMTDFSGSLDLDLDKVTDGYQTLVLEINFKENPMSAQQAVMKDEFIRNAFQKLAAAGLLQPK